MGCQDLTRHSAAAPSCCTLHLSVHTTLTSIGGRTRPVPCDSCGQFYSHLLCVPSNPWYFPSARWPSAFPRRAWSSRAAAREKWSCLRPIQSQWYSKVDVRWAHLTSTGQPPPGILYVGRSTNCTSKPPQRQPPTSEHLLGLTLGVQAYQRAGPPCLPLALLSYPHGPLFPSPLPSLCHGKGLLLLSRV